MTHEHGAPMESNGIHTDPALTVSLALAAGLTAQAIAHHLRLPGIVLLLAAGALLGPDVAHVIQPNDLGAGLQTLVGFAVAVILFDGGLNLNIRQLRRESGAIRRLITIGALVTAIGAAVAARYILQWEWRLSILFGTLVIVTGPTVIGPLVKRIKLKSNLQTVLEAEGVLIDPIGAITAVVALEVALQPTGESLAAGLLTALARLSFGLMLGLVGGYGLVFVLKPKRLIPENLRNVFVLAFVLALYHVSNSVQHESGIATVTIAGMVVGNVRTPLVRELLEFKEQLTSMLIGMLFVLLAADVRLSDIQALGTPGLWTLAAVMFVVRPLNVLASTWGANMTARERTFLCWLAPRGIVAAAVASLFAVTLDQHDIAGGASLRALVFLVIAGTVLVQGLTGGLVARLLGVRRPANAGYIILGANDISRALAGALRDGEESVTLVDSNADAVRCAQDEGFRVVYGNGLEERTLQRARVDTVAGVIAMTTNEEVNLLFARNAHYEHKVARSYVALRLDQGTVTPAMVHAIEGEMLFGAQRGLDLWNVRLRRGHATAERWRLNALPENATELNGPKPTDVARCVLPLVRSRRGRVTPIGDSTELREGDVVTLLVYDERRDEVVPWLTDQGWEPVVESAEPEASESAESS